MLKILVLFSLLLFIDSCSTSDQALLHKVQTWKVYVASSEQVFAAIDRYAEQEHFVLMRDDREAGRFLARRSEKDIVVERERVVMMAMAITQLDSVRCVIDARFSFANERGNSSQHDQQVLNRYFDLLFGFLDSQYREYLLSQ